MEVVRNRVGNTVFPARISEEKGPSFQKVALQRSKRPLLLVQGHIMST